MNLSKTKYCKGMQCPKILWMDLNKAEEFNEAIIDEARFDAGNEVGDLAMSYFGEYVEVPYTSDFNAMIAKTQELLATNTPIIAEATFAYNGDLCMVDILKLSDDGYDLIEVKSSTNSAATGLKKVKDTYFHDMSYQVYILKNCGIKINKVFLMQLNSAYVFRGSLDIKQLFVLTDCTAQVMARQHNLADNISHIKTIAKEVDEPQLSISSDCGNPYECGYKKWCFRHLPPNNIFDIGWRMRASKKDELLANNIVTFKDVLSNSVELSASQRRQILTVVEDLPPFSDKTAIITFLEDLYYPLYFLDFETYQQVIPQWDFVRPYSQIPFQYSLHIQNEKNGPLIHKEFLAEAGTDPRKSFAESLCNDVPDNVCVIAYNSSFEKSRIKDLADIFPDLKNQLSSIMENMVDLAIPFGSGFYYQKEMAGSFSIKAVLPALCPNDPQLDYHNLALIHNGDEAMKAFASLDKQPPEDIVTIRQALLAYCALDTLAMVKILEKLYAIVEEYTSAILIQ